MRSASTMPPHWHVATALRLTRNPAESANRASGRTRVHGITAPGSVSGAAVERLASGPADVASADTSLAKDHGGAHNHGRPDPLSVERRVNTDAADGSDGRAEHGREHGVRAGAIQQQGSGDGPGPGPGEQNELWERSREPAGPAGEESRLECAYRCQVIPRRLSDRDAGPGGAPGRTGRRAITGQVGHQ